MGSRTGQLPGQSTKYFQSICYSAHLERGITTSNHRWGNKNSLSGSLKVIQPETADSDLRLSKPHPYHAIPWDQGHSESLTACR